MEYPIKSVSQFYDGKTLFVTGATGFIGKVLVEKVVRCCPGVKKIHVLLRPKKSQDINARLAEILDSQLFSKLQKERPDFKSKFHAIGGDIVQPGLGICPEDVRLLEEETNLVFHSAATIRFDEPLRAAIELNVLAVRKMIQLCRNFKKLEVFLHVSTAYANCDRPFIEETIYPPAVDPQKLIDALETGSIDNEIRTETPHIFVGFTQQQFSRWMDDDMVNLITPQLIGNKPNTYTYTKQLAEHLLINEGSDLPLAIIRPSIVGAAWKEPFPGWIDSYNGPSGLYIAAGKGILRSMKGDFRAVADIVPVDIPVNMMITIAWYTAIVKPKSVLLYHCTAGNMNPFTWGEMENVVVNFYKKIPLDACFRRPNVTLTNNSLLHDYWVFVSHMIPAYIADFGYYCLGHKPRMVKIYNRLHRSIGTLTYFTMHSWEWTYTNLDMLRNQLSIEDRKTFYFDPRGLHWPDYIENYCLGAKKFLLNEDLSGLPVAKAHLRKLRNIRYAFNTILAIALWRILIARSQLARNLWFLILGLVTKFVKFFRITSSV